MSYGITIYEDYSNSRLEVLNFAQKYVLKIILHKSKRYVIKMDFCRSMCNIRQLFIIK